MATPSKDKPNILKTDRINLDLTKTTMSSGVNKNVSHFAIIFNKKNIPDIEIF